MKFNDISIKTRLMSAFTIVSIIVGLIGVSGYISTIKIKKAGTNIDAAMEMKLSVRGDMQIVMEMLAAEDMKGLDDFHKEHKSMVANFDLFYDAILNGAKTAEGTIYATDDERIKTILHTVEKIHNDRFVTALEKIYSLRKQVITAGVTDSTTEATLHEVDIQADIVLLQTESENPLA